MSLIGSLDAAVGGMNAQSAALSNISDNVANSQTVGFKGTNTAFVDYLTQSSPTGHAPGAVVARPQYTNSIQGAVTQVSSPTSLAITGDGFFAVRQPTGASSFNPQTFYTRAGDFAPNSSGYLINSTGFALNGWPVTNTAGTSFNTNILTPIKISTAPSVPVATTEMSLAANLPSTPPVGTSTYSSTIQVNDAGGNAQTVTMKWDQVPTTAGSPVSSANPALANKWNLTITSGASTTGPLLVQFGSSAAVPASAGPPATPAIAANVGMITSITAAATDPAGTAPTLQTTNDPASINLALNFGLGAQPITLKLGQFGEPNGITQFAGTDYQVASQTQDGSAQGNYSSMTIKPTGEVVINYDNGQTTTIGKVPLVHFNNPNALQQQDGQAFSATIDSGQPNAFSAGTGGTAKIVVGAVEASNVDIAAQFTQMIVAQRAYTANSKVVTTANSLMQDTLNMLQG